MPMDIYPNSQNNRLLLKGVWQGRLDWVQSALDDPIDPASPNVAWITRCASALETAFSHGKPEIVEALMRAGADPLFVYTYGLADVAPVFNAKVRQNLEWGPAIVAQVSRRWQENPPTAEFARACVRAFNSDHPHDLALLDALREHDVQLGADAWWEMVLESGKSHLVAYVARHFPPQPAERVLAFLADPRNLQGSEAVVAWAGTLSSQAAADFFVGRTGNGDQGALFASLSLMDHVAAPLWGAALANPLVISSLRERGLGGLFLTRAMRLPAETASAWLDRADALGVAVRAVRYDPDDGAVTNASSWGESQPQRGDTLLEAHLRHPARNRVSVALCRQLVRAGCLPTFSALELLCSRMTYRTTERQLTLLFRQWVAGGVDPAPWGKLPAWTAVRSTDRSGIASRLEAWALSHRLERRLGDAAPARRRSARL